MAFRTIETEASHYPNPEALFADIKQKKSPGLLAIQADVIRLYMQNAQDRPDVSIQLPTGAGKTLIGILIAEWLRREKRERVLYLCPTNQLANQVAKQSLENYGIDLSAFSGPKTGYTPQARAGYESGSKIAVTSYSSLFNANPFFSDPQVIILDDIHQAEGSISSMWSVKLLKETPSHTELFEATAKLLCDSLPNRETERIFKGSRGDSFSVEKLPSIDFAKLKKPISDLFTSSIGNTDQVYSWQRIQNNLHACHLYFSYNEILIRPLYPPTFSFLPFARARQRIYMSATMGNGGDLERIVGRKHIYNLSVQQQQSDRTVGRRFFCFPEVSLDDAEATSFTKQALEKSERAVYITPSGRRLTEVESLLSDLEDFRLFKASDIEIDKRAFCSSEHAVLLLANRYDGIDFPDDECRMLIIDGLPKASNLQESFQIGKLGLDAVYLSRIITRVTQAFGRTTRNTRDYSVVIVLGEEMVSYLQKGENRQYLLPELRAEIEFGLEQSKSISVKSTLENIDTFLSQNEEWQGVDSNILKLRDRSPRTMLPNSEALLGISENEISYVEAIWNANFSEALDQCRSVLGKATSPELRGVRGFWSYLAGAAASFIVLQGLKAPVSPEQYYTDAAKAAPAITWLHRIKNKQQEDDFDERILPMIDRLEVLFQKIGTKNTIGLDRKIGSILENIGTDESTLFERGQVVLGCLLGFDSDKQEGGGTPDPWWKVNDEFCIVFEDYTEALETSELSVTKARQATSHHEWAKENLHLSEGALTIVFIVSKITKADKNAFAHLRDVAFWNTSDFRAWAYASIEFIRSLWSEFPGPGNLFWRQATVEKISRSQICPKALIDLFKDNLCEKRLISQ